jgi:hypothetical protein
MRIKVFLAWALVAFLLTGCLRATSPINAISDEVEKLGFTVYNPPRADRGPGWVFHFVKTFDGKTVPGTVCTSLYPDERVVDAKISIPNVKSTDNADVSFGLGLLDGLIDNVQKASADLSAKSIKTLSINWGDLTARELPEERKFTEEGKRVPIGNACAARLRELRQANQLGTVFMVQQAVQAKSMTVSVEQDRNAGASLDVSLYEVLTVKPSAKVSQKSNSSIDVTDPRYIGFVAVAVLNWIPTDQLGAETATVSGRLLKREEINRLMQ